MNVILGSRSAVAAVALAILASTVAFEAAGQANDSERGRTPQASQPDGKSNSGAGGPASLGSGATGSDYGTGQSGYNTGQQQAEPGGAPPAGGGGASDTSNCATMPSNAAECPQGHGQGPGQQSR